MANIEFGKGGVPVRIVAEVYGKDACWVRAGLITGYLPIGRATRNGRVITSIEQMNSKFGRINYYISPKKLYYSKRMDMIQDASEKANSDLAEYILKGVTEGLSYEVLKIKMDIPCCKDVYYENYRKFFWILNKMRD